MTEFAATGIELDIERIAAVPGVCHVSVRSFDRDPSIVSPDESMFGGTVAHGPPGEVLELAWVNLAQACKGRRASLEWAEGPDLQSMRVMAHECTILIITSRSRGEGVAITVRRGDRSLKSMHRTVQRAWISRPLRRVLSPSGSTDPRRVPLAHKVRDAGPEPRGDAPMHDSPSNCNDCLDEAGLEEHGGFCLRHELIRSRSTRDGDAS